MKIPAIAFALLALAAFSAAAQDAAIERLEKSPRHGEWVTISSGDRKLKCFVVYPEISGKAPVVLVIHEIFGLTDWVRSVCDQLAEAGVIAIAPDFLSGQTFDGVDAARQAISGLPTEQVMADLDAAAAYARALPAASGILAVSGFCWGGTKSFEYACANPDLKASYVFYGSGPSDADAVSGITGPVYGFYGENDARVTSTVAATEAAMRAAGKTFEPVIYPGAGHGFMRSAESPDASEENKAARDAAWTRWRELLGQL